VTIDEAGPSDAPDVFVELCRLHAARWGERGRGGVLADTTTLAFHCDVIRQMAEARLLRLYLLRVDGVPAAGYYGFSGGRRWFYYLGGFDPAYRGHSVGSLVILHAVEQAARGGARELDFLRGAEPYKYGWGAVDCAVQRWRLVRASSSAGEAA
jgi:CelD/BcsL family acetyltransferase involved in cellulose biosynthesis